VYQKDSVIINLFLISHTRVTYSHLFFWWCSSRMYCLPMSSHCETCPTGVWARYKFLWQPMS